MIDYTGTTPKSYIYVLDVHGSVIGLADDSESTQNSGIVINYEYDAWGNLLNVPQTVLTGNGDSLADANPFRYCGYQFDKETGFYYLKYRYYIPSLGRFLTKDPMITGNRYVYCRNNPVRYMDSLGLMPIDEDKNGRIIQVFPNGNIRYRDTGELVGKVAAPNRMSSQTNTFNTQLVLDIGNSSLGAFGGTLKTMSKITRRVFEDLTISYTSVIDLPGIGKIIGGVSSGIGYGFAVIPNLFNEEYSIEEKVMRTSSAAGGVYLSDIAASTTIAILSVTTAPAVLIGLSAFAVGLTVGISYTYLSNKYILEPQYGQ